MCPGSLTIPVLGLEMVYPKKVGSLPWPGFFFEFLASKIVSSNPSLTDTNANPQLKIRFALFWLLLADSTTVLKFAF